MVKMSDGVIASPPKSDHLVLGPCTPLKSILSKSVQNFFSNLTDRQTDRPKNITFFFGGCKNMSYIKI